MGEAERGGAGKKLAIPLRGWALAHTLKGMPCMEVERVLRTRFQDVREETEPHLQVPTNPSGRVPPIACPASQPTNSGAGTDGVGTTFTARPVCEESSAASITRAVRRASASVAGGAARPCVAAMNQRMKTSPGAPP